MNDDIEVMEKEGNKRSLSEIAPLNNTNITVKRSRVDNTAPNNFIDQPKQPSTSFDTNTNATHSASSSNKETPADGLQVVCTAAGQAETNIPPSGAFKYIPPQVGSRIYAMDKQLFGIWSKAVIRKIDETSDKKYIVRLESKEKKELKLLRICTAKQIAYEHPCEVRLPFGKRVIALYNPDEKNIRPVMYAGIIAEPPEPANRYRYLIFFDDGYAQYTKHDGVRLVYEESKNVWEDIHPKNRDFIKSYCEQFPERPMWKLQKNQVIKAEFNGEWWSAKVVETDNSLVKVFYQTGMFFEWLYRGSTRLAPVSNMPMSIETIMEKCKTAFHFLISLSDEKGIRSLLQEMIDGTIQPEVFAAKLQQLHNHAPEPHLVPFLKKSLPVLRHLLLVKDGMFEGMNRPPPGVVLPDLHQMAVTAKSQQQHRFSDPANSCQKKASNNIFRITSSSNTPDYHLICIPVDYFSFELTVLGEKSLCSSLQELSLTDFVPYKLIEKIIDQRMKQEMRIRLAPAAILPSVRQRMLKKQPEFAPHFNGLCI